ncbi:MAG: hypothetical protein WCF26_13930 [Candidatus Sulfotelmatobacter sp.]
MAIESYRAAEKQIASEERARLFPGLEIVIELASKGVEILGLELPKFLALSSEAIRKNSTDNLSYLLECLVQDVERMDVRLETFESASETEKEALNELISEAAVRAAEAKSRDRVRRVARILANSFRSGPKKSYEQEREMIDTAVQVADPDASILGVMMKYQGPVVKGRGVADINETNETWRRMIESDKRFSGPRIHVSCARLQAQGLIIRMDRNPSGLDLATNAYSLTQFGVQFCEWCLVEAEK